MSFGKSQLSVVEKFVSMFLGERGKTNVQTVLMMFITVVLETFLSPNALMLNAPSSRELERCSRAKNRPAAHTKRILSERSYTFKTPPFFQKRNGTAGVL